MLVIVKYNAYIYNALSNTVFPHTQKALSVIPGGLFVLHFLNFSGMLACFCIYVPGAFAPGALVKKTGNALF